MKALDPQRRGLQLWVLLPRCISLRLSGGVDVRLSLVHHGIARLRRAHGALHRRLSPSFPSTVDALDPDSGLLHILALRHRLPHLRLLLLRCRLHRDRLRDLLGGARGAAPRGAATNPALDANRRLLFFALLLASPLPLKPLRLPRGPLRCPLLLLPLVSLHVRQRRGLASCQAPECFASPRVELLHEIAQLCDALRQRSTLLKRLLQALLVPLRALRPSLAFRTRLQQLPLQLRAPLPLGQESALAVTQLLTEASDILAEVFDLVAQALGLLSRAIQLHLQAVTLLPDGGALLFCGLGTLLHR
mmetsp:Transcript_100303/g.214932  ORF Transcript_100303/g.214932 Transcript_100303/m.214932 type:complete len:304 (+) Transcript_100303:184-1095(+)